MSKAKLGLKAVVAYSDNISSKSGGGFCKSLGVNGVSSIPPSTRNEAKEEGKLLTRQHASGMFGGRSDDLSDSQCLLFGTDPVDEPPASLSPAQEHLL